MRETIVCRIRFIICLEGRTVERTDRILQNSFYRECLMKISGWEEKRQFCRHDSNHLLHVARIAYIMNLEEGLGMEKEVIYAAALLHDIGRFKQYETGYDHALASAELAQPILEEAGFDAAEITLIVDAILSHRNRKNGELKKDTLANRNKENACSMQLQELIYRADKLSRDCYFCEAEPECNWPVEKKNWKLTI